MGIVGDIRELWDSHPDPFQLVDDPVTSTAPGWSEELGLKHFSLLFSSEKRHCVLLSASCQGSGNRFSATVSGAWRVHWDEDGK